VSPVPSPVGRVGNPPSPRRGDPRECPVASVLQSRRPSVLPVGQERASCPSSPVGAGLQSPQATSAKRGEVGAGPPGDPRRSLAFSPPRLLGSSPLRLLAFTSLPARAPPACPPLAGREAIAGALQSDALSQRVRQACSGIQYRLQWSLRGVAAVLLSHRRTYGTDREDDGEEGLGA
jgi:hypothetical protein